MEEEPREYMAAERGEDFAWTSEGEKRRYMTGMRGSPSRHDDAFNN